ncbi:TfoX/Sxy family protein [Sphingomonas canadensis]|uniref:TfoX/Sxy family protein n=1 Tax=Sphingomonas canadensis TaxID=1219257 RepID=A0ABW3H5U2_9SPHN|nr:TfoX/Sxy family protein [Sphingomonas canadensis]MCW3836615.1 TfoX/Sxy family protein [Sphingomonas canadensis]
MAIDTGLVEWVREALEPMGSVTMRPMMGAATLYCDGAIFAVADDGEVWFKSDAEADAIWDAAGCERFTITEKDGTVGTMNYRRAPADVYDDADAMREWGAIAIAAGLRAAAKKKPRKKKAK